MIISMKCHKAKKNYVCDNCKKEIKKNEKYYRLFGAAFEDDKPYEIIKCCNCINKAGNDVKERLNKRKIKQMKVWDKEFYELMNQFEKDMETTSYRCGIKRVTQEQREKLSAGEYYNDGETNKLFNVYMMGYTYRKRLENLE